MFGLRLHAAAMGVVCTFTAIEARADPAGARLDYRASEEATACGDEGRLRSAVTERLGTDPFRADAAAIVHVSVTRAPDAFVARVLYEDDATGHRGERTIESPDGGCAELTSTLALTIAIMLDPHSQTTAAKAPPPPEPPPEPPPDRAEVAPAKPAPAERTAFRFGGGGVLSAGAGPAPAFGVTAFAGAGRGPWSIDLEGRADLRSSLEGRDGTSVGSSLLIGLLAPCRHVKRIRLCVLAAAGALHGDGRGAGAPDRDSTFYAAAGVRVGAELPIVAPLDLRLHLDPMATLTPTSLAVAGTTLWSTPPVSVAVGLDLLGVIP